MIEVGVECRGRWLDKKIYSTNKSNQHIKTQTLNKSDGIIIILQCIVSLKHEEKGI